MTILWLLRMARWARRPPGRRTVTLWLVVLGVARVIGGIEYFLGWPEALTLELRRSVFRP